MKILHVFHRVLNTKISPMVYIMAFVSVIIGFGYSFLTFLPDIQNSLLYKFGIPLNVDFSVWGVILLTSAIAVVIGMMTKWRSLVEPGALFAFMCWLFAAITYLQHGFYFAFLTYGLFHMIFFAYVYLASALGYIQRVSIDELLNGSD